MSGEDARALHRSSRGAGVGVGSIVIAAEHSRAIIGHEVGDGQPRLFALMPKPVTRAWLGMSRACASPSSEPEPSAWEVVRGCASWAIAWRRPTAAAWC